MSKPEKRHEIALFSAWDKTGLPEFARDLLNIKNEAWSIYGSEGTVRRLVEAGIEASDISEVTELGPILGHQVVTLHPKVHGAILGKDTPDQIKQRMELGIPRIGLVYVNMYPYREAVSAPGLSDEEKSDKMDIGGPTLLRSAVKRGRIPVSRPEQIQEVLDWLRAGRPDEEKFVRMLAGVAMFEVTSYDMTVLKEIGGSAYFGFVGEQIGDVVKGENGGQRGAVYQDRYAPHDPLAIATEFKLRQGAEIGSNNETDISRSVQTMTHIAAGFDLNFGEVPYVALGVKHNNACGAAVAETPEEAIANMMGGDYLAVYGGTVSFNFPLDEELATLLVRFGLGEDEPNKKNLLDVIVVPEATDKALEILYSAKGRRRVVVNPALSSLGKDSIDTYPRAQSVRGGGMLVQDNYTFVLDLNHPELHKTDKATPQQLRDVVLADAICRTSNSNTITIVEDGMLLANAVGQQARIYAVELAIGRANRIGHEIKNATVASDSFFSHPDGPKALVEGGIGLVFTTTGSDRDNEALGAFEEAGVVVFSLPDSIGRGFSHHAA